MIDLNIEFGHIYVDEKFDDIFLNNAKRTKKIISDLDDKGLSYCLSLLIDDYNPKKNILDIDGYLDRLKKIGVMPDYVLFESELTKFGAETLSLINNYRLQSSYTRYIKSKNHMPCSFLIVIWYFLRLGILDKGKVDFYRADQAKGFEAKGLLNILQGKYQEVEDIAIESIRMSDHSDIIKRISYDFIEV